MVTTARTNFIDTLDNRIAKAKARIAELDAMLESGRYKKSEENKMLNEIWRLQRDISDWKDERIRQKREEVNHISTKALCGGAVYCDNKSISETISHSHTGIIIKGICL